MTERAFINIFCLALIFSSTSCTSIYLGHAKKSLQGTWNVTSIYSQQKDRSGPRKDGKHKESGDLGFFKFSEKEVSYSYKRINKNYSDTFPWTLSAKKVANGFWPMTSYTLTFKQQAYEVWFRDRTSKNYSSEKNARKIELHPVRPIDYNKPYHILWLTKE